MHDDAPSRPTGQAPLAANLTLDDTQRWFQAAICGASAPLTNNDQTMATGAISPECTATDVLLPSRALSVDERLDIYRHAYVARLVECLRAQFPMLRAAAGDEAFDALAMGYLQAYPSRSYTLNRLGDRLAEYLRESRPPREADQLDWADLLADLATLEWTIDEVFDGPGDETAPPLDANQLGCHASGEPAALRVQLASSLRLLQFEFPLHAYYTRLREAVDARRQAMASDIQLALSEAEHADAPAAIETVEIELPPMPAPAPAWLAIVRRNYVVWRYPLSRPQFATLQALARGESLAVALEATRDAAPQLDETSLAAAVQAWFTEWTANGLIVGLHAVA